MIKKLNIVEVYDQDQQGRGTGIYIIKTKKQYTKKYIEV